MARYITKIKLHNYKKFGDFEIELDEETNILVGDNDAGKSSILEAVDLTLNASNSKISTIGYENLVNSNAVKDFLEGERVAERLPDMWIELYFNEQNNEQLFGRNNSEGIDCDGLRLTIAPTQELEKELIEFLQESEETFPFDYYNTSFKTFAGDSYYSYRKFLKSAFIDNTKGNNEHALNEFIKGAYNLNVEGPEERAKHHANYRAMKTEFSNTKLKELNDRITGDYSFQLKTTHKANVETDLSINEDGVSLENRGKGRQVVIKAEITLQKSNVKPDIVLIEEPENHLSHVNMNKLIETINSNSGQLIVSTHSNLISSRLDLKNCVLVNSNSAKPLKLKSLSNDTADYFMKAPPHNALDFVLSNKVILVEGVAEYILMKRFFEKVKGSTSAENEVHIISVGGTAFKRYLEIAKILGIKTAVIRDNDGDPEASVGYYEEFVGSSRKIFTDSDSNQNTFEVSFYNLNTDFCENVFSEDRRTLTVQDFMLKNKADAAFEILKNFSEDIEVPSYIVEAIEWISE